MSTNPNEPQHGGYGIPNQPQNQPPQSQPQNGGYGIPNQSQNPQNGGYGFSNQPPAPGTPPQGAYGSPYQAPQNPTGPGQQDPNAHFPAPVKPLNVETSYAWMYFFGVVGAHKFYMRQTMQGVAYAGAFLAIVILGVFPLIGDLLFFVGMVALYVSIYGDIRTMREQVERSNAGETFPIPSQLNFVKKAFGKQ